LVFVCLIKNHIASEKQYFYPHTNVATAHVNCVVDFEDSCALIILVMITNKDMAWGRGGGERTVYFCHVDAFLH
jgi:hypothetical protein